MDTISTPEGIELSVDQTIDCAIKADLLKEVAEIRSVVNGNCILTYDIKSREAD
jgi:hypothetical protein